MLWGARGLDMLQGHLHHLCLDVQDGTAHQESPSSQLPLKLVFQTPFHCLSCIYCKSFKTINDAGKHHHKQARLQLSSHLQRHLNSEVANRSVVALCSWQSPNKDLGHLGTAEIQSQEIRTCDAQNGLVQEPNCADAMLVVSLVPLGASPETHGSLDSGSLQDPFKMKFIKHHQTNWR